MLIYFKWNVFLGWQSLYFSYSVTWSFSNHYNVLIWCSRNISYYYQCWKELLCLIFLWKLYIFLPGYFILYNIQKNSIYLKHKYFLYISVRICLQTAMKAVQESLYEGHFLRGGKGGSVSSKYWMRKIICSTKIKQCQYNIKKCGRVGG